MCQLISLTWHLLLDQMVLAVLSKDSMNLLGGIPTDIRSKHDAESEITENCVLSTGPKML